MRIPRRSVRCCVLAIAALLTPAAQAIAAPDFGPDGTVPIPDQLMVKFERGTPADARDRALERAGAQRKATIGPLDVVVVRARDGAAALRSLRGSAVVEYAEADAAVAPAETVQNDFRWPDQWSQPKTRTTRAWDVSTGAGAVVVAVLDSGIDYSQPDFDGKLVPGRDVWNGDADPRDDYGHGTKVAGVVGARAGNGVGVASYCPGCSVMPVKIAGPDGSATWSTMASGLTWAADHGARVINLSFAGTGGSSTVLSAARYARSKGALVFASAGNYNTSTPYYPAAYAEVIGVAGSDGGDAKVSSSNYGSWVDVAAPGCNESTRMMSTGTPYGGFCGTSSASPAAAGIAALAFSATPGATHTQVEQALGSSAVPVGTWVANGRVDAWGTLAALGVASPSTPATPTSTAAPVLLAGDGTTLSGTPQPGGTLGASAGGWSGSGAISVSYGWRRCDSAGANCVAVGVAAPTYSVGSSDTGHTLRVVVTATSSGGSSTVMSAPSALVGGTASAGSAPDSTSPPAISGTAQQGQALTASTGTWSGSPTSYSFQWQRCDSSGSGCTDVAGATAQTYALDAADVGSAMRVVVTASNAYGSGSATSAPTAGVTATASAPSTLTSTFTGSLSQKATKKSFAVTVGAGDTRAELTFTKVSQLTLSVYDSTGAKVATASGPSVLTLTRTLPAGTYTYEVSGSVPKGSASFSLKVTYAAP